MENHLAEYLRALLRVSENPNDDCQSFSLIIDAIWFHATSRLMCNAGRHVVFSILR